MTAGYKGHGARTGGLQRHSIGDLYPYAVQGVTTHANSGLQWQALDCRSGSTGVLRRTYSEAVRDIISAKIRSMMWA